MTTPKGLLISTIAREAGISRSSVKRGIDELVAAKLLRVQARKDGKVNISSIYTLIVGVEITDDAQGVGSQGTEGSVQGEPTSVQPDPTVGSQGATGEALLEKQVQKTSASDDAVVSDKALQKAMTLAKLRPCFDEFWSVYPLKKGKIDAEKCFERAVRCTKTEPQVIVEGARRYRDDPQRDPAYTAWPSTWLNRGSWEDEMVTVVAAAPKIVNRYRSAAELDAWNS